MNELAELRISQGLTVRQLAEKSGVSQTTITRLENGLIKSHPVTLGRLARALGVEFTRLNNLSTGGQKKELLAAS